MKHDLSDIAVIERILAGDTSGYRVLAQRHKDYAFTLAYRIVGNHEDAEEIAQDAFMQAFGALPTFNREAKFTTWFYRIVFNAAAGFKRKHKIWTDDLDTSTEAQRVAAQQPAEALQQDEQRHYLRLAMHRMLPDDATILTLFYLQEHTLDEIATVTGITADTVKVKLHRARKRLAEEMKLLLKNETKTLY